MANGEGYLRQRANGTWTMTIFLGKDEKGKPRQLVRTSHGSKRDAQAEMARLVRERDQGIDLRPQTTTFKEVMDRWLKVRSPDLAPSTASTYETLLRVHVEPVIGRIKLQDLKPLHIENVKSGVLSK